MAAFHHALSYDNRAGYCRTDGYLVLDDFGDAQVWRECSPDESDHESVIAGLVSGQYNNPVRIVAFNPDEHYCEDVSADITRERYSVGPISSTKTYLRRQ